jgi:hypothetical protein
MSCRYDQDLLIWETKNVFISSTARVACPSSCSGRQFWLNRSDSFPHRDDTSLVDCQNMECFHPCHLSSWTFFVLWKTIPTELEQFISIPRRHDDCEIEDEIFWLPTQGTFSSVHVHVTPLHKSVMTLNLLYRDKLYSKHCQTSCKTCGMASRLAALPLISHRLLNDALDLPRESHKVEFLF